MRRNIIKCCYIGEHIQRFSNSYENKTHFSYQQKIENLIETHIKNGVSYFVCGDMNKAELRFAETVLRFREKYPNVELEIDLAFREYPLCFTSADVKLHKRILERADMLLFLFNQRDFHCKEERDYYIVDNASHVIAVYNGLEKGTILSTIRYAKQQSKQVDLIDLASL